VRLSGEGVEEVGQEVLRDAPAGAVGDCMASGSGVGREVVRQGGEAAEAELAAPVVREVDAVVAEEVRF
jgi:hypothetical protein